jgi:hypothetical protein
VIFICEHVPGIVLQKRAAPPLPVIEVLVVLVLLTLLLLLLLLLLPLLLPLRRSSSLADFTCCMISRTRGASVAANLA